MKDRKIIVVTAVITFLIIISLLIFSVIDDQEQQDILTYTVSRGDLIVDVVENGNLEAARSTEIRSEVEGRTTIISIVPEGTIITQEDIDNEKVLVELDSSQLRERALQEEINVRTSEANYTEARENYDIQVNQNESDLSRSELNLQFAHMDIQRHLGWELADKYIEGEVALDDLLEHSLLAGAALKKYKSLENSIDFAREESARATTTLTWTERLYENGYATQDELQADRFARTRREVDLDQALIDLELYKKYEFPKETESLLSDYREAKRELERTRARNRSRLSQAESRKNSNELTYRRQLESYNNLLEQIERCTIVATRPGLIIYGDGGQSRTQAVIEPGAEVRERQALLTIPDMSTMIARTQIHESIVTRLEREQRARVTIDSLGGMNVSGQVSRIALLPDYQHRWLNPDLKVYSTEVSLDETHEAFKPGMSVQVRIIINEIEDVMYVPLQAVTTVNDQYVCFIRGSGNIEQRLVEVGDYNDRFIEIRDGLSEGEEVVLNALAMLNRR